MDKLDPQVVSLAKAIRTVESNNNFTARSKDGSFGAYQFIKPTWEATSKKYGVNAEWEKATPQQQNEVAYKQLKEWKDKGYNVGQIASMWNAGPGKPDAYKEGLKGTNKDGVNYDVAAYAKKVAENYQKLKAGTPTETPETPQVPEVESEKRDGFLKSLVKAPLTMLARPVQLGYEFLKKGDNTEEMDRFSKEKLGGFVAPIPQNTADLKKDVGRGIQTVAFGMPGLASGGAAFGVGASMEEGNDLFSLQTAFQAVLGAGGAKVLGLVGTPLLNASGKIIGKITPQVLKDIASRGSRAITEFAAAHKILPDAMSKGLTRGANIAEDIIAKPFDVTGQAIKNKFVKTPEKIISAREKELAAIDNNYVNMRKASGFSPDEGVASRRRIAQTDVLVDAVDENGLIRTNNAIKRYKALTIDGSENVVRNNLIRSGEKVNLNVVERELIDNVKNSKIEGADLINSLNNVKKEIRGLRLKADQNGNIPLALVHDAKISTTAGINYLTPAENKTYRKAIARGYKKVVEKNSNVKVELDGKKYTIEDINKEIGKYLDDIAFLKRLDGKRVKGGKLGKYFAQISGNIVGGAAGAMIGGIPGSAVGTVVGGELGGRIRGSMLKRALGGAAGFTPPKNRIIQGAVDLSKSSRLMLPAPKPGAPRTQIGSGKTINLPSKSQSSIDEAYLKSLGNRNIKYNNIKAPSMSSIKPIISPKSEGVNSKEFLTKAKIYTPIFRQKVDKIAKKVGLDLEHGPLKTESRLLEKAKNDYKGDITKVSDINRSVIFVKTLDNKSKKFFDLIKETEKHFEITRKKFNIGTPGYQKTLINVKTPAGISEIQLTTKKMWDMKMKGGGDVLYGLQRAERTPKKVAEAIGARMEELYAFSKDSAFFKAAKSSNEGGFTADLINGIDFGGTPHISVSPFPERTMKLKGKTSTKHLADFIEANFDLLQKEGYAMGGWYNKVDKMTYLDVVIPVPKSKAALAKELGNKSNQIAGYDLEDFVEIKYSGDGTTKGVASLTERNKIINEILSKNKPIQPPKLNNKDYDTYYRASFEPYNPEKVQGRMDVTLDKKTADGYAGKGMGKDGKDLRPVLKFKVSKSAKILKWEDLNSEAKKYIANKNYDAAAKSASEQAKKEGYDIVDMVPSGYGKGKGIGWGIEGASENVKGMKFIHKKNERGIEQIIVNPKIILD